MYSEPGRGTTFKVYLPASDRKPVTTRDDRGSASDARGSENILLVEDSEPVRRLAHAILDKAGYAVIPAENGQEALTLLVDHDGPVHLLLTDVVMLQMNDRQLFEKASELHLDVKVIFMSGYTDNVIAHRGVLEEGIAFVQKPFTVRVLSHKVREILDAD